MVRIEARGSRPTGLVDSQRVRVWRNGRMLGVFRVDEFNWDLWCEYVVLSHA